MIQCIEYLEVSYAAQLSPAFARRRTGFCSAHACHHASVFGVRVDRGDFRELCIACKERLYKRFMEWTP
jgi:hypothetical protein